jgi:hypothetical protein
MLKNYLIITLALIDIAILCVCLGECMAPPIGLAAYKDYWNSFLSIIYKNQDWDFDKNKYCFYLPLAPGTWNWPSAQASYIYIY